MSGGTEFWFGDLRLTQKDVTLSAPDGRYWGCRLYQPVLRSDEFLALQRFREQTPWGRGLGFWQGGALFWPLVDSLTVSSMAGRVSLEMDLLLLQVWGPPSRATSFLLPFGAHLDPDEILAWERAHLADPASAGPYSDWCEEHNWPERAAILRNKP